MEILFFILAITGTAVTAFIVYSGIRMYGVVSLPMKYLTIYFSIDLMSSIGSMVLGKLGINNMVIMNMQIPVEYGFFVVALSFWVGSRGVQRVLRFSIIAYLVCWLILFLTLESFFKFSSIARPLLTVLVLIAAVVTLVYLLRDTSYPLLLQPAFWICSGLIIYNAGNATFFLITQYLFHISENTLVTAWVLHNIIGVFSYVLFAGGFICQRMRLNSGGR
ncbi:MAG: hypothetical protein EPO24_15430 [Bacteroidetes bacterium]|nr:MAG: hypothetical protein EPO24_15430 [Bacteroidota bacterium]